MSVKSVKNTSLSTTAFLPYSTFNFTDFTNHEAGTRERRKLIEIGFSPTSPTSPLITEAVAGRLCGCSNQLKGHVTRIGCPELMALAK